MTKRIEIPLKAGDSEQGIVRRIVPSTEVIKKLEYIKDNPELWKVGRYSGADQYQGLPPAIRYIDDIINFLK